VIKFLSKLISYLFHPLIIPTWYVLLLLYAMPFSFAGISTPIVIGIVWVNTFMFPAITILLLRKLDFIDSFEMPDKSHRIIPLIATIIFYVWAFMALKKTNYPLIMNVFMLGTLVSLFLSFFINVFHKLSLHMVGISGALTAVLLLVFVSPHDFSYVFLLLVLLCGAIATARLFLQAHTVREVYTGFMVGMFGQVLGLMLIHVFL
jgi:hypothetical protein